MFQLLIMLYFFLFAYLHFFLFIQLADSVKALILPEFLYFLELFDHNFMDFGVVFLQVYDVLFLDEVFSALDSPDIEQLVPIFIGVDENVSQFFLVFEEFSHRLNDVVEVSQPVFHKLLTGFVISVFAVLVVEVIVEDQESAIDSLFTHADNPHFAVVQLEQFSLIKIYLVNPHNFAVPSVITLQKIDAGPENAIEFGVHTFFQVKLDFIKRTLESFQQVTPDFSQFFILHVEFEVLELELFTPPGGFFLGV